MAIAGMLTARILKSILVATKRVATLVSRIAEPATQVCCGATCRNTSRPPKKASRMARLLMLSIFAPSMLPAASSAEPPRAAATAVTSSGSDVAPASSRDPTHKRPRPILDAMTSAAEARKLAATTMTTAAKEKSPRAGSRLSVIGRWESEIVHSVIKLHQA